MLAMLAAMMVVAKNPVDLSWLPGYWLSCDNGKEVSETWSDMRAGIMFGTTVTFHGGEVSWEYSRIGPGRGGYSYFAQVGNQPVTEFALVRNSKGEAVFENRGHDFPQRVIYRRTGNMLLGRIEGVVNGKARAEEWHYRAAPLNTRCWTKPPPAAPRGRRFPTPDQN